LNPAQVDLLYCRTEETARAQNCHGSARPRYQRKYDFPGAAWSGIYSALWYPALPIVLGIAGGGLNNWRERLGNAVSHAAISSEHPRVWVHAASIGEIEGVRPVIQSLAQLRPDVDFVITTMTLAGRDAAHRRLNRTCQLAPFDHPGIVRSFLARTRPTLLIIAETELWPNYFLQSAAAGARIAVINGRVSRRSMTRYRIIRPLIARALACADVVLAQTALDADRFQRLGAEPGQVAVTGNAKYEIVSDSSALRPALAAFTGGRPILIAGSTGPGEEEIVLTAFRELARSFPSLALVLAPRHLQRTAEVEQILRAAGLSYRRASALDSSEAGHSPLDCCVLLLDTIGELSDLYHRATIAFVGGSLTPGRGGQSLAEPANASVPVLFGPYYENYRQLGDALVAAESARVVHDAAQIVEASAKWLADRQACAAAGQRARSVMEQFAGNTAITVRYLCGLLSGS
jgi:3-deoxy-D-manno-octulosonic-acid transferase